MRDAYNDYVSGLPATGYNSAGHLIWQPSVEDLSGNGNDPFVNVYFASQVASSYSGDLKFSPSGNGFSYFYQAPKVPWGTLNPLYFFITGFIVPVSGFYLPLDSVAFSYYVLFDSGLSASGSVFYDLSSFTASSGDFKGSFYSPKLTFPSSREYYYAYFSIDGFFPVFEIIPTGGTGDTYNINTRASTITGDVYYFDNNGDAIVAENVNIFNETNNTYYNPVTQRTRPAGSWTYDYNDRSYACDCEDGTKTIITFSDECIIIQEDDEIYYVYYGTPAEQHVHEWYQTGEKKATCTDYGTKTYTCYTCGEEKTDILPALGHDWVQYGYVPARYDDEGNVVEKAHVLYYCSRCMEEYKDYDGVGPPSEPAPDDGGEDEDKLTLKDWLVVDFKKWFANLFGIGGDDETDTDLDIELSYTDEDGNEQKTSVKGILAAFGWWKQVADIGKTMVSQISAAEVAAYAYDANAPGSNPTGAPSIPVNLSAAQSRYGVVYGEDMEMLDLSWYTPYKQTVDQLVSGFLWLFFLWALFRHVPAIFSGAGLTANRVEDIAEGQKGRRR